MSNVRDYQTAHSHYAEAVKDRRRPGRVDDVSPALIPLLRNPTGGSAAGNLAPIDSFQIAASWAASAYPTDVWLCMDATERSAAIYRELRKLDAACDARERAAD